MKSVLVVCVGNICRSPMAEGIMQAELPDLKVSSAGIGALVGHRADPIARQLMSERSIDIEKHLARQLTLKLCLDSDLILVMEREHLKFVQSTYPVAHGKIFLFGGGPTAEVPDPYRQGREAFEVALSLIDQGAGQWVHKIKKITQQQRQFT